MPSSESRVQMKEADNYCTRHFRVHHISTPTVTQKKDDLQKKKEKRKKGRDGIDICIEKRRPALWTWKCNKIETSPN